VRRYPRAMTSPGDLARHEQLFRARQVVTHGLPGLPLAFSTGGRTAEFHGPLGDGLLLGGFVVISVDGAGQVVGQVRRLDLTSRVVADLDSVIPEKSAELGVSAARANMVARFIVGEIGLLGRLTDEGFDPDPGVDGFDESLYRPAGTAETELVRKSLLGDDVTLTIGTLAGTQIPAHLRAKGFARHTFLCGQSGSGKTYATGVLLEQLRISTTLPILVFDPNSDHVHLGRMRDGAEQLPGGSEYQQTLSEVVVARARGKGGDLLLAAHFSDADLAAQALVLGLDPVDDLNEYAALRTATESLQEPFSAQDVAAAARAAGGAGHELAHRIENLGIADWGIWCQPGEKSLVGYAPLRRACAVLDLGSLATAEERLLASVVTLRTLWRNRDERRAIQLVVDEAHNLFPSHPQTTLERYAVALGSSIAAEGRKYGLHLFVATQRPSKVADQVVSQCDNLALLRMNSEMDVEELTRLFSHVPAGLIHLAPTFRMGQILFGGPISEVPMVVQVGSRLTPEGGGDVPTDWLGRPSD
jgi:uncharacterized protein